MTAARAIRKTVRIWHPPAIVMLNEKGKRNRFRLSPGLRRAMSPATEARRVRSAAPARMAAGRTAPRREIACATHASRSDPMSRPIQADRVRRAGTSRAG